jgi:hypothetical protein
MSDYTRQPSQELESVPAAAPANLFALRPRGHRPAVVADANALISDAIRRSQGRFTLMPFLAQRQLIQVVTAEHIDEKVYARLPVACRNAHADLASATAVYESLHRPLLRLVSIGDLMADDARVGVVALADEEDMPLAQLAVLLAPSLVLTQDRHLLDAGFGAREWGECLSLMKDLIELDAMMWGAADGVVITGALTVHGVGGIVNLLRRSELVLGVVIGLSIALGYQYRHQLREAPARLKERSGPVIERVLTGMSEAFERWEAADRQVRPRLVAPREVESLEAEVARVLLQCTEPVGAAAVHPRLPDGWRVLPVEQVMAVLRAQSAFEFTRGRGWTLGHRV